MLPNTTIQGCELPEHDALNDDVQLKPGQTYIIDNGIVIQWTNSDGVTVGQLKEKTGAQTVHAVKMVGIDSVTQLDESLLRVGKIRAIVRIGDEFDKAKRIAESLVRLDKPIDDRPGPRWPGQTPNRITRLQRKR